MSTTLFIIVCILSIIVIIIYTFVSSAIHKLELCRKSPYYHCDTSWTCCTVPDCDANGSPTSANSYKVTDQFYGPNAGSTGASGQPYINCDSNDTTISKSYYQSCIAPVKIITTGENAKNTPPNFSCLYDINCSTESANTFQNYVNEYPELQLQKGQCCYKKIDPSPNNSKITTQYYPTQPANIASVTPGAWNTQEGCQFSGTSSSGGVMTGDPSSPASYTFTPKNKLNTVNNSCYNTMYGKPSAFNPQLPYQSVQYKGCESV